MPQSSKQAVARGKIDDVGNGPPIMTSSAEAGPVVNSGIVFSCCGASVDIAHRGGIKQVLHDITFDLGKGEILTIVGPSGTGKTTLMRLLGGFLRPTRGTLTMNGAVVDKPPDGVVIVFQDYGNALLPWRTVADNVALGLERRLPRAECRTRVAEALELVGLTQNANDHPWQLSGGMQQRVQIARALATEPAVLLMDEPFGALDAMTKASLQDRLLLIRERTKTSFVFITHDIEEAIYLGDRIAVLNGSPGHLTRMLDIDLPLPRDQVRTRQAEAFLAYRAEVHAEIDHRHG
jgi:NitT/TauT family transport system ATP-binding protein